MFKIIFSLLVCVTLAAAQFPINGTCPEFTCKEPVEMTSEKIQGIWYLAASIPYFFHVDYKCTYINQTAVGNSSIKFEKKEYNLA
jgi:hypothetical protein